MIDLEKYKAEYAKEIESINDGVCRNYFDLGYKTGLSTAAFILLDFHEDCMRDDKANREGSEH